MTVLKNLGILFFNFFMCDCEKISFAILLVAGVGFIFLFFAQFIGLSVWFSRISPYFKHAEGYGLKVYQMVSRNFYIYLAILVVTILIVVLLMCCRIGGFFEMIFSLFAGIIIIYILITGVSLFFGYYAIFEQITITADIMKNGDTSKGNCYKYITTGLNGTDSYYGNQADYIKWKYDLISKAFDSRNRTTKYICQSVYSPILAFGILLLIFLFILLMILSFGCFSFGCSSSVSRVAFEIGDVAVKLLH